MNQKAPDELVRVKSHDARLLFAFAAIVLPLKTHLAVSDIENAVIGDRHAMRVAARITEHLTRAAERMFRVNHPFGFFHGSKIPCERGLVFERFGFPEELQLTVPESFTESCGKHTAEQARENAYGQKETGTAGDPLVIRGEAAAGDDEVYVRMMRQILSPRMKDAEEADLGAEMFRIARDGEQRFGGGAEENAVNDFFVMEGDAGKLVGNREDDMEVFDRQQFSLPACLPAILPAPCFGISDNGGCGRSCRRYACNRTGCIFRHV